MEPFPSITHVEYFTLVWEAINKNGSACDYVSQKVISNSLMKDGYMHYGPRRYHTLFIVQADSLEPAAAAKLSEFIASGGRIFCIETIPEKSLGWNNYMEKDKEVAGYIEKMKAFSDRFILLKRPVKDFIGWYRDIQKQYNIDPYLRIENPNPYVFQNRYQADDGSEIVFIINSHLHNSHKTKITFSKEITAKKQGWIWDPETGNRYKISLQNDNSFELDLGPADSLIFVFDKEKKGPEWIPLPVSGQDSQTIANGWKAEFIHCHDENIKTTPIDILQDLKDMPDYVSFAGTVIYRNEITVDVPAKAIINLGKVYGLSELTINGIKCGVKWYGRRIFDIGKFLKPGKNSIEIKVVTSMGNYMKSLTGNPIAQYWTNEKNKIQPIQSMGLIGPVTLYKRLT
jgi:hypothetical protein